MRYGDVSLVSILHICKSLQMPGYLSAFNGLSHTREELSQLISIFMKKGQGKGGVALCCTST